MTSTPAIILLGTGSDVGKSIVATAFCRILKNRGYRVAPFKAQNMSNNSYVTIEGGEIGRAQVAQAEACGLPPSVHMNPILLKPSGDLGSQVVLQGAVLGNYSARDYYDLKSELKQKVKESYTHLASRYDVIVMEGAGSCCEVNLRAHDLVNFEMALMAKAPAVLVADIDRGGVFAQIVGSMEIIPPEERDLVAGFIINKFRGDPTLFQSGIDYLEQRTRKPVFGLVPFLTGLRIDTEDSMSLDQSRSLTAPRDDKINIAVVRLPHVSNFTDLEVLAAEPDVLLNWLEQPAGLTAYDAVILPGSKNVMNDAAWLAETGWTERLTTFAADPRKMIVGLCGGFQMLGTTLSDPHGVEGDIGRVAGLGLLNVETALEATKTVQHTRGRETLFNTVVSGYEIHMGQTRRGRDQAPFLELADGPEGAAGPNGNVIGTYLHGLFDAGEFRSRLLARLAGAKGMTPANFSRTDHWAAKDEHYDRLAAHVERYVDMDRIIRLMNLK